MWINISPNLNPNLNLNLSPDLCPNVRSKKSQKLMNNAPPMREYSMKKNHPPIREHSFSFQGRSRTKAATVIDCYPPTGDWFILSELTETNWRKWSVLTLGVIGSHSIENFREFSTDHFSPLLCSECSVAYNAIVLLLMDFQCIEQTLRQWNWSLQL